ncbi:hypothetical protein SAMN04488528_10393 [Clostridium frigidicarnis]|uniref:Uncharacterized protein n=1 Tax=Clostridium frigidicarnis TaxID=84698 RepID=A0A1I1ALY3_9CLOT|nr:hypothetical protein SAMN04488528_10393 [Clostridium frigidicarnis]
MSKRHKGKNAKKNAHNRSAKRTCYKKIVNYFFIFLSFIIVLPDRYETLRLFMKKIIDIFS